MLKPLIIFFACCVAAICVAPASLGAAAHDHIFGGAPDVKGFAVRVVSSRAGLIFTDDEPLDVRVMTLGALGAADVRCSIREWDGPWNNTVRLDMPAGVSERPLQLEVPGRGLYKLTIEAVAGGAAATAQTSIAVLFPAAPPGETSPWGIFYARPLGPDSRRPTFLADSVDNIRRLGASWVRLNWWSSAYGKVVVAGGRASADCAFWKKIAAESRRQGLYIMGEFAMCPRELSSRPDDTVGSGDAGPTWARVKPADYNLWNSLVEQVARDFATYIGVWEIWNEPDIPNAYWTGSADDFAVHVEQTAAAIRRGNPGARVAAAGFCALNDFTRRCFELGMGRHIDILSFHYSDEYRGERGVKAWRTLAETYNPALELWNTEERSEVPLNNMAQGAKKTFKFIHVNVEAEHQANYEEYRPLVENDLTARPSAVWFSVGAHCIGPAEYAGASDKAPGVDSYFFRRGPEVIGAFSIQPRKLFGEPSGSFTLGVEPLSASSAPTLTDRWGRSRPLELKDGRVVIPIDSPLLFVNGASGIDILDAQVVETTGEAIHIYAVRGRWSEGWGVDERLEFSERKLLDVWAEPDPDSAGYWVEIEFEAPAAGRYDLLFSGNALSRLKPPRSLSPFVWSLNGGDDIVAADALPVIAAPGSPEGLSLLGVADVKKGLNVFRLMLTGRRDKPDNRYALWFAGLVLRPHGSGAPRPVSRE